MARIPVAVREPRFAGDRPRRYYPFRQMGIGDEFEVRREQFFGRTPKQVQRDVMNSGHGSPGKFATHQTNHGIVCTRLE